VGYDLSKETHPNYAKYSQKLEDGWIFGRKVDNSDTQLSEFRDNIPSLALGLVLYLISSHLFRIFYSSRFPVKLATQPLKRAYFFLGFSAAFLYVLFGNSVIFIFTILSLNYAISRTFQGSIANPIITWIFNLSVLYLNETYKGYHFKSIDEHLAFLDRNRGLLARWDVNFNISMLRLVSYNMDYYWSFYPPPNSPERNDRDLAPLTEKDRINTSCYKEDYNFIYYLSYVTYTPLYLAGPIITYNNFISQLRYPREITLKDTILYGIRLLLAMLTMEFMLHYIYAVAISNSKAWENDTPFELGFIGIFNLLYVWLK
ncbi:7731_t:CDS:2, partial [Acaulospora morrowiae]